MMFIIEGAWRKWFELSSFSALCSVILRVRVVLKIKHYWKYGL